MSAFGTLDSEKTEVTTFCIVYINRHLKAFESFETTIAAHFLPVSSRVGSRGNTGVREVRVPGRNSTGVLCAGMTGQRVYHSKGYCRLVCTPGGNSTWGVSVQKATRAP